VGDPSLDRQVMSVAVAATVPAVVAMAVDHLVAGD
jgi:hypothetical protein